ncbi:aminotransferase class III-fold pyridoxal phosphate-dependent enzyme [Streptomyces sp. HGB0020]|uniref:aminotransferase class III-fold pyridoxal phosphate-dependent enzyme n=1 Tax=Streptomyces sp. HGB0020 TaxID=1078086 RepID=UPI00034EC22A|nr:aminotransferase class III-fold pyridoxal phosphate-dependent enzyme [Streptomyces sp. HGB0020]EPD65719.1 2,4-diaminobutyrate 4-transaminase [Streptomyces sp. HGB0020]
MPARVVQEGILRRQAARESAARTYARAALPIVPVRARGMTIEGADGRRYLDCQSGAGALALGHNHPVVLEAIRKVLDSGAPLHALDLATPVKDAFITELFRTLPPGLTDHTRVQFCGPAEADAVEAAFKLVRSATGRAGILAFTGAHHGTTTEALLAFDASRAPDASHSTAANVAPITRLPYPQDHRCPFGVDVGVGGRLGAELASRWAESALDAPGPDVARPAGMILQPVQGEGGVLPAPDAWMRRMREITAARSIPLIVDETQTGVGRTGAFWAVEHSGITPDVMVLSGAIGGSLPLSLLIHRDDLDLGQPEAPTGAFRGNQLAMAAGTATLTYVRENHLADRAATLGARMLDQLRSLRREFPCVGDVRGRGLMLGVEFVEADAEAEFAEAEFVGAEVEADAEVDGAARVKGVPVEGRGGGSTADVSPRGTSGGTADEALDPAAGPRRRWTGRGQTSASAPAAAPPAAPELAAAVQRECLRRGLIVELGGPHTSVVRLLPPLTISDEQAAAVLDRLADAVQAAAGTRTRTRTRTRTSTSAGASRGLRPPHEAGPWQRRQEDRAERAGLPGG